MTFRLSALALGLTGLLGLAGCGGMYEEAAYPEAPPPAPRPTSAEAPPEPEAVPPPPESQELVVGGDNDDGTLYRETDPSALTEFRTTLDPYGSWVDDDTYGTVWVPSATVVGSDFTPYVTAGRWTYDDGYVWASDYDWGWAPFHYGRWVYIGGRGWSWIPGRVYRGAWVVWRTGPSGFGYVGWGPAPPGWYWRGGYAYGFSGGYRTPYYFCETRHVFHPQVGGRVVRGPMANDIGKRTEPYVPAEPRIDQGRVAATPRVGEGSAPSAIGATGLRRGAAGPELASLGQETSKVPRPALSDKGLARAYDLGAPKSAVALGARAPSVAPRPLGALAGTPSSTYQGPARVGGVGPVARDHAVAPTRLPPLRSEHSLSTSQQAPLPRMSEARPSSPPMVEHHRMPDISSSHSSPSFHTSPSYRSSAPSSPAPRAPSVSSPSFSSRSPSSPSTFRSPSPSVSRPSSSPSISGGGRAPSSAPRGSSTTRVRR